MAAARRTMHRQPVLQQAAAAVPAALQPLPDI